MAGHISLPLLAVVLVVLRGVSVIADRRNNVCTDVTDDTAHTILRPKLSNVFTVKVESKLENEKVSAFVKEYYDLSRKRGRLTVIKPQGIKEYYMDYDQNVILEVNPATSKCIAGVLLLSQDQFIFGYRQPEGTSGHMFSPSGALHFGNVHEEYVGHTTVRGIPVDQWYSCQYIQTIDATAKVNWYFSRRDEWHMQEIKEAAPVRMTVEGEMLLPNKTVKSFNNTYDFLDYEPRVFQNAFEVPDGVYCPGRDDVSHPKPFPKVPSSFFFVGELNDPYTPSYRSIEETYSTKSKISTFTFKLKTSLTDINSHTELNDFNTGVSYLVKNKEGGCTVSSIKDSVATFSKVVNDRQIRMETPREFFMDKNITYQYAGKANVRDIPCERWVAMTDNAKGHEGTNVTVEWYFSDVDHYSWNNVLDPKTAQFQMPVRLTISIPGDVRSSSYEMNIFYFNAFFPGLPRVDLRMCFLKAARKTIRFAIDNVTSVQSHAIEITPAIQRSISMSTGISPLRVMDVQFYYTPSKVWVTLDLVDKPPHYNDVQKAMRQNSLKAAYQMLQRAFDDHTLIFSFAAGSVPVTLSPNYTTLEDLTSNYAPPVSPTAIVKSSDDSTFYSPGALAGLGIAMLVVGGGGGSAGAFFFLK